MSTSKSTETTTIFLNITQHQLSDVQLSAIGNLLNATPVSYKAAFDQETCALLENSPNNEHELRQLVKSVMSQIDEFYSDQMNQGNITIESKYVMFVHMPIGSPAFMAHFWRYIGTFEYYKLTHLQFLFSHTERISTEIDGKKVTEFRFSHFIEM